MVFDPMPAARILRRVRQDRGVVEPLPEGVAPAGAAEGAAVQVALAELVGAVPPRGVQDRWRRGGGCRCIWGSMGRSLGSCGSRMFIGDMPSCGSRISCGRGWSARWRCGLAHDLPPGPCSLEQALAAVGDFFAGIEVVENRYGELTALGTPTLLADQMYHAAAVVGDGHEVDWRGLEIGALRGRISLRDGLGDEGVTSDLLGHPLNGLAWLAGSVEAAAFGGLKAGQVVMLGSVTPPVWLEGPAFVTVEFPPLPAVTVRLG